MRIIPRTRRAAPLLPLLPLRPRPPTSSSPLPHAAASRSVSAVAALGPRSSAALAPSAPRAVEAAPSALAAAVAAEPGTLAADEVSLTPSPSMPALLRAAVDGVSRGAFIWIGRLRAMGRAAGESGPGLEFRNPRCVDFLWFLDQVTRCFFYAQRRDKLCSCGML